MAKPGQTKGMGTMIVIVRWMLLCLFVISLLLENEAVAQNETIIVTTSQDKVDFDGQQMVDDLPGADGKVSFREACIAANQTAGPQTIHFAIPLSDWDPLFDEFALLELQFGVFLITGDETTIDFSTQTDFTGDTNPNGKEVGIYGYEANGWGVPAIIIGADNCRVVGLGNVYQRGSAVSLRGNNNRIEGCVIFGPIHDSVEIEGQFNGPAAIGNVIGGNNPEQSNILGSLLIAGPAEDSVVIGNTFDGDGVRVAGSFSLDLPVINTRIGGVKDGESNVFMNAGSFGSEGFPRGSNVSLVDTQDTVIQGNTMGLKPDGITPEGQIGPIGIDVFSSINTTIVDNTIVNMETTGTNHAAGQRFGKAIAIKGNSTNTTIQRNLIGVNQLGQPIGNLNGITFENFQGAPVNATVGGSVENGNTIMHSENRGILLHHGCSGIDLRGNLIFDSGFMGIDLNGDGITLNDNLDADDGANGLQNYPTVTQALSDGNSTSLVGFMASTPNNTFHVEFFVNSSYSATGFGEGESRLGEIELTTGGNGSVPFEITFPFAIEIGDFVSAIATNLTTLNSSEFAPSVEVEAPPFVLGDVNRDGVVDLLDVAPFVELLSSGDYQIEADVNEDGIVNLLDVAPFIDLLSG